MWEERFKIVQGQHLEVTISICFYFYFVINLMYV